MASRSLPSESSNERGSGKKRPPRPVFTASLNSSLPEIRKSTADDSDTTRRHTPSSVPRVKPSSKSQPEWAKLSQKISFDENSPPSSIRSTPAATWNAPRSKTTPSRPDPPAVASGYSPAQQKEEDKELKTSVSISDILSRLETVRKYIKDALAIQAKLQEHPDEPGSETQLQLSKLSILIEQLHQQEASYLNILLSIMGDASENDVESALADKQEEEDEDEEDDEEEEDEEDDEESSDDGNDSLSLQAEMAWQLERRKREKETALKEMQALKDQHALLTKLLEQQSQLEALERKQVGLLAQQKEAEDQLSCLNAERKASPGKPQQNKLPKQQQKPSPQRSETRSPGEVKLMAARAEKAQLDDLLAVVRAQKSSGRQAAGGVQESPLTKTALPPPSASPGPHMSVPQTSYMQPHRDEVVVDEGTITEAEMQAKMKMVGEARSRLHELQDLLSVLQLSSSQSPAGIKQQQHEASKQRPDGGAEDSMRPTLKTAEATEAGYSASSSQAVSVDSLDTSDKNAPTGLDQSLLEEYEQRVQQRQRELQALRQEREELIQLDAMLQDLIVTQEQESSSKVTQQPSSDKRDQIMAELERQKQLKEELIKKTHRLQQLKGALSKHKNGSAQDDSTFYGVDTTAATWGGSTVVSDSSLVLDEDGQRLASAPDAAIASGSTMYSSATYTKPSPDLPQYRVDRHTPRANRAQRRSFSSPEDQAPSTGKKIKLEASGNETASHREPRGDPTRHQALRASNFSAAWPSVIFSSHTATKRAEEEETGENEEVEENEQPPNLDQQQSRPPPIPPLPPSASSYTELLHHQLSSTTVMCSELLQNHGSLLQALHQQLNALPYIQDQLIWLNQYYDNLRNYHHYLAGAFAQVSNMSADGTIRPETNGMEDATPEPRRKDTHEDPLASARGGQGGNDNDFLLPPPPSSWPASFPPSWSSSQQQSPFMFNPTGFPHVSPYLSPYRPGAGQWWGMDPAHGRPASRQGYTFGSNATGVGADSVAGASVRAQPPSVTSVPSVSSWQAPPTTVQSMYRTQYSGQASPLRQQPPSTVIPEITVRQPANVFDVPLSSQSGATPNTSTQQAFGILLPEAAADTESQSSIPISLPEDHLPSKRGEAPDDEYSVFDTLRDTIYSEVAAVIAGNEGRPHFLVELFRELQLLKTDYLRQRALFLIQDLVTKYLTDEAVQALGQEWLESGTTTEDDEGFVGTVIGATPKLDRGNSGTFDYTEPVESASSVSTPVEPFASDALGDTVIRAKSPASNKPTTKHAQNSIAQHNTSQSDVMDEEIESESLDEEIKAIMMEVIPLLKSNLEEHCTTEFLQSIQECVMTVILQREEPQAEEKEDVQEALDVFARQLEASLIATLGKYEGKRTKECGEDLLVDVSEVLFREMAFFKLIKKPMSPHSQDFRSVTSNSQTTTDAESYTSSPLRPLVGSKGAVPQSPASSVVRSLLEEEEGLGKSRDDELAKTWDNSKEEPASSESDQEDQFVVVTASDAKLSESEADGDKSDSAEKVPLVSVTLSGEGATAPAMEGGGDDGPPVSQQLVATANGERQPLTNIPLADLEAQMNREQASTEGVAVAALEVTDPLQELAGTGEELPSQVSSSEP